MVGAVQAKASEMKPKEWSGVLWALATLGRRHQDEKLLQTADKVGMLSER